jgi:hypothetical protein
MKTLALTVLTALVCVGCTTYPQNYTYSPTVTVTGGGNTPINLPNPFAKTPHKRTEFIHTYTNSQPQTQYVPRYGNVVVPEYNTEPEYSLPTHVQTDSRYYYEADPDSRPNRQCQTTGRDIITELETFVIP